MSDNENESRANYANGLRDDDNGLSNAKRFINAYNSIDYSLRTIYDMKRSLSFSDAVRRCVPLNSVIRKYEEKLIDYGRLRNSIVHSGSDNFIIAEPHVRVVAEIEKIAELVSIPPLAKTLAATNVFCLDGRISLKEAIRTFNEKGFSNLPVLHGNVIVGVLNARRIAQALGDAIMQNENIEHFLNAAKTSEAVMCSNNQSYYVIKKEDLTIEQALNLFFHNRKLMVIILTKNGGNLEKPTGILTNADVIDMNHVLETY